MLYSWRVFTNYMMARKLLLLGAFAIFVTSNYKKKNFSYLIFKYFYVHLLISDEKLILGRSFFISRVAIVFLLIACGLWALLFFTRDIHSGELLYIKMREYIALQNTAYITLKWQRLLQCICM